MKVMVEKVAVVPGSSDECDGGKGNSGNRIQR